MCANPPKHAAGVLPGAVLAPLGSIQEAAREWPKDQPLLMVCRSGRRAQKAADELRGFVGGGLAFAAVTDTCAMGMLLMKLPWNRA